MNVNVSTEFEDIGNISQTEYLKLLSRLAKALNTRRHLITLTGEKQTPEGATIYRVKRKGYSYQIEFKDGKQVSVAREI